MEKRMKLASLAAVLLLATLASVTAHGEGAAPMQTLSCEFGPVPKTYGMASWLVYTCDSGQSVLIVSAPGSPAAPFTFRFSAREGGYVLQSQGTGDKEFTAAAFGELKVMSVQDVEELISFTKAHVKQ
jgi:hypothetical protein